MEMGLLDLFHSRPDYYSTDSEKAMAMLDRIDDQKTLRKIATDKKNGKYQAMLQIRVGAAEKLNDQDLYSETVCGEEDLSVFTSYIGGIRDVKTLTMLETRLGHGQNVSSNDQKLQIVRKRKDHIENETRKARQKAEYEEMLAREKRMARMQEEQRENKNIMNLQTDTERVRYILLHSDNTERIARVISQITDRNCLLELLGNGDIDWSIGNVILKRMGYSRITDVDDEQILKKILEHGGLKDDEERVITERLGYSDKEKYLAGCKLFWMDEREVIRELSIEEFSQLKLTVEKVKNIRTYRGYEFTEEIIRRYADSSFVDELIALMFKVEKTPVGNTYEGPDVDWAAKMLHIIYENGICRDKIESQNGKVIHKEKKPAVFDMSNPEDREWASGYVDNSHPAIVFDAASEKGQRIQ